MRSTFYYSLILSFIIAFAQSSNCEPTTKANLSCVNPSGKEVDWFIIYLIPEKQAGGRYFSYVDDQATTFKNYDLKERTFPPLHLVKTLKNANTQFIWNDDQSTDTTSRTSSSKAHSKGMLAYDASSGFHLLHSLPRFPHLNDKGEILFTLPSNAGEYGQTFFCVSINKSEAEKMSTNVRNINPFFYENSSNLKVNSENIDTFEQKLNLVKANEDLPSSNLNENLATLVSRQNTKIQLFLKIKHDAELPWEGELQSLYKKGFFVETWTRPSILPNVCKKGSETLGVLGLKINNVVFSDNNDHSKWGVSMDKKICCYGDLNRTESQKKRSGMVMCFENETIGAQIFDFITDYTKCKNDQTLKFIS